MHEENRKRRKKQKIWIFVIIAVIILGGFSGVFYIDTFYEKGYIKGFFFDGKQKEENKKKEEKADQEKMPPDEIAENVKQKHSINIESNSKTSFQVYRERFLICTQDGVRFFNDTDDQKWNDTFTMNSPISVKEGEFTAVGDMSGRTVRVYDADGLKYMVQTEGALIQFALNKNGYLATISNNKNSYKIMIYNASGAELKGRVEETVGIYPLSVDISDDNRVFAVSYLDTADIEPIARVLFFYINRNDGENFTDSMFAAVEKADEIIPTINYMGNGVLAAVSDKNIYGLNGAGEEVWQLELTNQLERVDVKGKEYIVAAYGDELTGKEGKKPGTVVWIDRNGKENTIFEGKDRVTYLNAFEDSVVIGCGHSYYDVKSNGKVVWEHRAMGDVSDILLMDGGNNILYVTKNTADIMDINTLNRKVKRLEQTSAEEASAKKTEADENK